MSFNHYGPNEYIPTEEERALAVQLHDEGWIQTSAKYRHIRRWAAPPPSGLAIVAPEYRNTPWGRRAAEAFERWVTSYNGLHAEFSAYDVTAYRAGGPPRNGDVPGYDGKWPGHFAAPPNPLIEERELTRGEFKAYKDEQRRRNAAETARIFGTSDKSGAEI